MKRKNRTQKKEENIDGKDKNPLPSAKGHVMEMKKRDEEEDRKERRKTSTAKSG